ncbi:PREDICTED: RING-H2 finger protein ATL48-like [Camelina sativa]|uniref:RING-type E3 ubiquitin transferase n=1 Tax=Camelina sativa TaxID=90675 RepID=A0ABM0T0X5_CAMSA|nr:PREDICTED: RING-H2 finger protein ATL48-like [Camelina sativa]
MSEIEELVCIDECVTRKSSSNTVEIRVMRKNMVTLDSSTPLPPFPTPHLLLNNILSFDDHKIYPLLFPTLPDPDLCRFLSYKIASEAEKVPGPLYISLDVTLSPQIVEEPEMETCAICLEEEQYLFLMPNCSHVFHSHCINEWLCWSNQCPLCRAELMEDEDW